MDMPDYKIGKIVIGSEASVRSAYDRFKVQPIDEVRLAPEGTSAFPSNRQTLKGEAQVAGIGTFNGKEPKLNDEGLFVVEGNGTLRAEVFYEDGSCDIIAKEIIAR